MRNIILASQSPRRIELLTKMGVTFKAIPSQFDEKLDDTRPTEEVAIELAVGKAAQVAEEHPDCIVIGSDTIVTIDGSQLEKPRDAAESQLMLKRLGGTFNVVTTSLAIICKLDNIHVTDVDNTRVFFKPYDETAVADYVATGDGMDKAGSYGIQSGAAALIDHIEGHYDTVIGFPTHKLAKLLRQIGVAADPVELVCPVDQLLNQE